MQTIGIFNTFASKKWKSHTFVDRFTLFSVVEVAVSSLSTDFASVALALCTTCLFCFWWRGRSHSRWCLPLMGL